MKEKSHDTYLRLARKKYLIAKKGKDFLKNQEKSMSLGILSDDEQPRHNPLPTVHFESKPFYATDAKQSTPFTSPFFIPPPRNSLFHSTPSLESSSLLLQSTQALSPVLSTSHPLRSSSFSLSMSPSAPLLLSPLPPVSLSPVSLSPPLPVSSSPSFPISTSPPLSSLPLPCFSSLKELSSVSPSPVQEIPFEQLSRSPLSYQRFTSRSSISHECTTHSTSSSTSKQDPNKKIIRNLCILDETPLLRPSFFRRLLHEPEEDSENHSSRSLPRDMGPKPSSSSAANDSPFLMPEEPLSHFLPVRHVSPPLMGEGKERHVTASPIDTQNVGGVFRRDRASPTSLSVVPLSTAVQRSSPIQQQIEETNVLSEGAIRKIESFYARVEFLLKEETCERERGRSREESNGMRKTSSRRMESHEMDMGKRRGESVDRGERGDCGEKRERRKGRGEREAGDIEEYIPLLSSIRSLSSNSGERKRKTTVSTQERSNYFNKLGFLSLSLCIRKRDPRHSQRGPEGCNGVTLSRETTKETCEQNRDTSSLSPQECSSSPVSSRLSRYVRALRTYIKIHAVGIKIIQLLLKFRRERGNTSPLEEVFLLDCSNIFSRYEAFLSQKIVPHGEEAKWRKAIREVLSVQDSLLPLHNSVRSAQRKRERKGGDEKEVDGREAGNSDREIGNSTNEVARQEWRSALSREVDKASSIISFIFDQWEGRWSESLLRALQRIPLLPLSKDECLSPRELDGIGEVDRREEQRRGEERAGEGRRGEERRGEEREGEERAGQERGGGVDIRGKEKGTGKKGGKGRLREESKGDERENEQLILSQVLLIMKTSGIPYDKDNRVRMCYRKLLSLERLLEKKQKNLKAIKP